MRAIVLSSVPYADHGYMVHMFTRETGMTSVSVHSGGRSSKFRRSYLTPLSLLDVELSGRSTREVRYVSDVSMTRLNAGILSDPRKMLASQFVAEMLARALKYQTSDSKIFDSIESEVINFDAYDGVVDEWLVGFLLRLMRLSGIEPNVWEWEEGLMLDGLEGRMTDIPRVYASLSPELSQALFNFLAVPNFRLTQIQCRALICFSIDFFRMHLEGFGEVKSLALLGY